MAVNCIYSAFVGDNLKITNTITSGTPPYHAIFKKGSTILQDIPNLYTTEQTVTYPIVAGDVGTVRFTLDVSDSCPDGAKSTSQYCDIVITAPIITGSLAFDSNPHNAQLVLDGTVIPNAYTPVTVQGVPVGDHPYEFRLAGYNNFFGNATAIAGQTVTVPTAQLVPINPVCTWITGKGGWTAITAYNIMELVSGYSGATNLGFTVTAAHIMGAVAYYSDQLSSGNSLTGCAFS